MSAPPTEIDHEAGMPFSLGAWLWASLAAIIVISVAIRPLWSFNTDVSWIITVCEKMLAGKRLYVDVLETNPPFSMWLYMPPVFLAKMLGLRPEIVVMTYVYAIELFGFVVAIDIAKRAGFTAFKSSSLLLPAWLAILLWLPGKEFGEREHLGVALLVPYAILAAWRLRPGPAPSRGIAVLVGALASVIVIIKPHYVLLILAPAVLVAVSRRSIAALFHLENCVAAILVIAYATVIYLVYPDYLLVFLPLLAETYLRIQNPFAVAEMYGAIFCFTLGTYIALRRNNTLRDLGDICAVIGSFGIVPLVVQGKGWSYQAYPAIAFSLFAIAIASLKEDGSRTKSRPAKLPVRLVRFIAVSASVVICALPLWASHPLPRSIQQAIKGVASHPTIAVISSEIADGHPLTRTVDGSWLSPYCSDWLGYDEAYLEQQAKLAGNQSELLRYKAMLAAFVEAKVNLLETTRPQIIVTRQQQWTLYFESLPRVRRLLQNYHTIWSNNLYTVLLRDSDLTVRP